MKGTISHTADLFFIVFQTCWYIHNFKLLFVCFSTCCFSVTLQVGNRKLFKARTHFDGFDGSVFLFFFNHVSIMCPQNSRKGSCIGVHVMDLSDRCHLSRPWGVSLFTDSSPASQWPVQWTHCSPVEMLKPEASSVGLRTICGCGEHT